MEVKRNAIAIIMALCMILSVPHVVYANTPEYDTTENISEIIPIFGFVGLFESINPPDDPEIYVEIPIEILFAAFNTDNGEVTSPRYTIKNLSTTDDVKVEIQNFEQRDIPYVQLDGKLSLDFVNYDKQTIVDGVFPANYSSPKTFKSNLSRFIDGTEDSTIEFMIGGTWTGEFDTELQPVFDMTLKFSRAE